MQITYISKDFNARDLKVLILSVAGNHIDYKEVGVIAGNGSVNQLAKTER
jgi:hypothetical protein